MTKRTSRSTIRGYILMAKVRLPDSEPAAQFRQKLGLEVVRTMLFGLVRVSPMDSCFYGETGVDVSLAIPGWWKTTKAQKEGMRKLLTLALGTCSHVRVTTSRL